ncbi:hypothetical protein J2X68_003203 [Streptomyces sp. 3330]|nr:hypothetical protein [Streptomyces sp. 3330]
MSWSQVASKRLGERVGSQMAPKGTVANGRWGHLSRHIGTR